MSTDGMPGPVPGGEPQCDAEQAAMRPDAPQHDGAQEPGRVGADGNLAAAGLDVLEETRTQPLRECVRDALVFYLKSLDGHEVNDLYEMVLKEVERPLFETVLAYAQGNQTRAARLLGMSRGTLRKKLTHYRLLRPEPSRDL